MLPRCSPGLVPGSTMVSSWYRPVCFTMVKPGSVPVHPGSIPVDPSGNLVHPGGVPIMSQCFGNDSNRNGTKVNQNATCVNVLVHPSRVSVKLLARCRPGYLQFAPDFPVYHVRVLVPSQFVTVSPPFLTSLTVQPGLPWLY